MSLYLIIGSTQVRTNTLEFGESRVTTATFCLILRFECTPRMGELIENNRNAGKKLIQYEIGVANKLVTVNFQFQYRLPTFSSSSSSNATCKIRHF